MFTHKIDHNENIETWLFPDVTKAANIFFFWKTENLRTSSTFYLFFVLPFLGRILQVRKNQTPFVTTTLNLKNQNLTPESSKNLGNTIWSLRTKQLLQFLIPLNIKLIKTHQFPLFSLEPALVKPFKRRLFRRPEEERIPSHKVHGRDIETDWLHHVPREFPKR